MHRQKRQLIAYLTEISLEDTPLEKRRQDALVAIVAYTLEDDEQLHALFHTLFVDQDGIDGRC